MQLLEHGGKFTSLQSRCEFNRSHGSACCSHRCDFPSCSRLILHRIFCRSYVVSVSWIRMSWTSQNISNSPTGLNVCNWLVPSVSSRLKPVGQLFIKHKGRWGPKCPSRHLPLDNWNIALCLLCWVPSWELVPGILSSSPGFRKSILEVLECFSRAENP